MKKHHLLLFILFSLLIHTAYTQEISNFHFRKYQVNDGLSENTVFCMLQDKKGYIWLGTRDGLNKFDGSTFTTFRSLSNNFIRSIVEGDREELYVATEEGVYVMDMVSETFVRIELLAGLSENIIFSTTVLLKDKKGMLWIGTMADGVFTFDPEKKTLTRVSTAITDLSKTITWTIYEDNSGIIWLGTRAGLFQYNVNKNMFDEIEGLYELSDSSEKEIYSIFEDHKGNLWLGTWDEGIILYNRQQKEHAAFFGPHVSSLYISHIRAIMQYDTGNLLIGADDGLFLFDTENKNCRRVDVPYDPNSLSDQNVFSMLLDREGGIWIGTCFGGLNYLNTSTLNIEHYVPNDKKGYLSGKAVSQFCEDGQGNIWVATEDGGLNYFDTKTKQFSTPVPTSYYNIHALVMDGDNLWIGTFSRGIDVYNTKTKQLRNYRNIHGKQNSLIDDCIYALYKTRDGEIYIGTTKGLNRYNRETDDFTHLQEDLIYFVFDIKEDMYKNLWIATYNNSGVVRLNGNNGNWTYYSQMLPKGNPIVNSKLTGIHIDNQNRLWFSSEGRGIFLYKYEKDNFINYSEKEGLPNNNVYGIQDDHFGNLWVSSNQGLVCFQPSDIKNQKRYTQEDGLQSNEFNFKSSYKASDGKLYFGGINGFNCFYPQELSNNINTVVPPVRISRMQLLGEAKDETEQYLLKSINEQSPIKLSYKNSSFTISYVSLSFIAPKKNQYAYMLDGVDTDWIYVGNDKRVTYVNLSPGKYTFRVKASNNHNIWNEEGAEVKIEILPPFWQSLTAKILYFLFVIAAIYFLIHYFVRRTRVRQTRQLENYKTEQETLAFKSKIDFFTNIAHEIRTPVSLIKAPLEDIITSGDGNNDTRQNLSIIEKNSERLTVLINQLLDFRKMDATNYTIKPEKIDLAIYITDLYERFRKTAHSKKYISNLFCRITNRI